jgi:hypothetical protein
MIVSKIAIGAMAETKITSESVCFQPPAIGSDLLFFVQIKSAGG